MVTQKETKKTPHFPISNSNPKNEFDPQKSNVWKNDPQKKEERNQSQTNCTKIFTEYPK